MGVSHQPDQSEFRAILSEDLDWKSFPAFPSRARLAVLVGHPAGPGPYVIRVKVPGDVKLMPHKHPEDRIYTVVSGVFYIGLGETFDGDRLKAYPPGSVIVLPGETWHFHWAKSGEYVTQVTAIGPLGLEYRDPQDDPRLQRDGGAPRPLLACAVWTECWLGPCSLAWLARMPDRTSHPSPGSGF